MIKSVAYEYHWSPKTIKKMYCDDFDFEGLVYWYDELIRIDKIKPKS